MTWNEVRQEIVAASRENAAAFDVVRRSKIAAAEEISGVPLIIYATDFTDESRALQYGPGLLIELDDKTGFLQAMSDLPAAGPLDVLLHSPGGSPPSPSRFPSRLQFNRVRRAERNGDVNSRAAGNPPQRPVGSRFRGNDVAPGVDWSTPAQSEDAL